MTNLKRLSGTVSKQMHSGKSGCLKDEAYVSRTPNVNTGDTYYNYEMHTLTSKFHVFHLFSLSLFSGTADVSFEEAKRKQKGYRRRLTNDNGHGPFVNVARIYVAIDSANGGTFIRSKGLVSSKLFCGYSDA